MYDLTDYGAMISDLPRTKAYEAALQRAIRPGSVVLDIGTGTGIFALLACRFGARKVYAIEPSDAIHVARRLAADNGFADRIEFIQDLSTQVTLPERADVIVSDLRGVMPLFGEVVDAIIHARQTFLAEGGTLIPCRDTLWAGLVNSPQLYQRQIGPSHGESFGFNMRYARQLAVNSWRKSSVKPDLLAQPQCWGTLDYRTISSATVAGKVRCTITAPATAHGLSVWFDGETAEGIGFSNSPLEPDHVYGRAFLAFEAPILLQAGETVGVEIRAVQVGGDYVWQWNTDIFAADSSENPKQSYRQSTFFGVPYSAERLRRLTTSYCPRLSQNGEVTRFVLGKLDGCTSAGDLAGQLLERFPHQFTDWKSALEQVYSLSEEFGQKVNLSSGAGCNPAARSQPSDPLNHVH